MESRSRKKSLTINIVCDNPKSWIIPYAQQLITVLKDKKHTVVFCKNASDIQKGDIAVLLGCEKIVKRNILDLNVHNLVVHESNLPKGKGMSPLTWQILEGKNKIPVTLFEAEEGVDAGVIYAQEYMQFTGTELVDDLRKQQGEVTVRLVIDFIDSYPKVEGKNQRGKSTYYRRRTPQDSELNIDQTIREQFNLLRVVDNERYPATFIHKGHKYILKIYEDKQ